MKIYPCIQSTTTKQTYSQQKSQPVQKQNCSFKALLGKDEFMYDFTKKSNWAKEKTLKLQEFLRRMEEILADKKYSEFDAEFYTYKAPKEHFFEKRKPDIVGFYLNSKAGDKFPIRVSEPIAEGKTVDEAIDSAMAKINEINDFFVYEREHPSERAYRLKQEAEEEAELERMYEEKERDQWDYLIRDPFPM